MKERGQSLVEFVLVSSVLMFLLGGIVDFGRAGFAKIKLADASREGARLAAVGHFDAERVERNTGLQGLNISLQTTTTEVAVRVEYSLPLFFLGILGPDHWVLHDEVVMRREQ